MNRPAVALPVVLFAVAITGALAVGGAYVSRQMASGARLQERAASLDGAAERAVIERIAAWDSASWSQQQVGTTLQHPASGATEGNVWTTRLSPSTFWIVGEVSLRGKPLIRRRLGAILQVNPGESPRLPSPAWIELP